ncbi:hypothetical protein N657DRAFT_692803 [Parathielavia appendiculata]|uniref:Uncharacterized protein n=1 Tax=Parathielavia appendiculata TaxID=2587402 RepID=A0AAN6Z1U9_9PEZI|nr:hypothetical protein N657DRAFT_692803 [Parathielavia appendiculata]
MPSQQSGTRTAVPGEAPFIIVTTSSAKPDAEIRRQIRSHVMRGKNRKHRRRRDADSLGSWINGPDHLHAGGQKAVGAKVPRPLGNDLTQVKFAVQMQPYMVDLASRWFTVIKRSIYPVEACVQPSDSQWLEYMTYDQAYLHSVLCSTQGFFDFVREAKFGPKVIYYLNKTLQTLREHLADDELATSNSTISTVLTLVMLSDVMDDTAAAKNHLQGLYQLVNIRGGILALQNHMDLQAKVLRADLGIAISTGSRPLFFSEGFSWDPYLLPSKNKQSNKATIRNDNSPNESVTKSDNNSTTLPPNNLRLLTETALRNLGVCDPRLLNILLDLQEFSLAANLAFQTGRKIPAKLYTETLVSVQYRLLALRDEDDERQSRSQHQPHADEEKPDQREESETGFVDGSSSSIAQPARLLLRLGMLAFTTTTFLQIKQLPMRYTDLARRMRECVLAMAQAGRGEGEAERKPSLPQAGMVELWFCFVARISVLRWPDEEEALVAATARALAALGLAESGWEEVRAVLRGVMWIDWVHSGDGKEFWDTVKIERGLVGVEGS